MSTDRITADGRTEIAVSLIAEATDMGSRNEWALVRLRAAEAHIRIAELRIYSAAGVSGDTEDQT